MPFEVGLSGDQVGHEKRSTAWTTRLILTHAAVGRVEDAGVHDDDGTRRWKSHRWTDPGCNVECVKSAPTGQTLPEHVQKRKRETHNLERPHGQKC